MKRNSNGQFTGRFNHPIFGRCTLRRDGVVQSSRIAPRTSVTLSQYVGNARVRNAAALWNVLKPLRLEDFFTDVKPYTKIAADANNSPALYGMVKEQKAKGFCTIAPILVSWGEILPVNYDETLGYTNISIGDHTLDDTTSFADFCRWIVEYNPAFEYGDKLSIIFVQQGYINENPLVRTSRSGIILEKDYQFNDTLAELNPEFFNLLSTTSSPSHAAGSSPLRGDRGGSEVFLTIDPEEKMCAFAFVHSGWRDGKINNSTQHLICRFDPWDLQLPLLRAEFKSLNGILSNQPIFTREISILCEKFGFKTKF